MVAKANSKIITEKINIMGICTGECAQKGSINYTIINV